MSQVKLIVCVLVCAASSKNLRDGKLRLTHSSDVSLVADISLQFRMKVIFALLLFFRYAQSGVVVDAKRALAVIVDVGVCRVAKSSSLYYIIRGKNSQLCIKQWGEKLKCFHLFLFLYGELTIVWSFDNLSILSEESTRDSENARKTVLNCKWEEILE